MSITRSVMFLGAAITVSLIGSSAPPTGFDEQALTSHGETTAPALVERVRQVTLPFRDIQHALSAGYAQFLGCVSGPMEGAMGIHYVNSKLVEDGELDVTHPEAMIYEQEGEPHLVGVEYIVPVDAWHARHKEPPVLDGQVLQYSGSPNRYGLPAFYELHVWAWRENPHGAFVDWNPRVSCEGQ